MHPRSEVSGSITAPPQHDYHEALKRACSEMVLEYDDEIPEMLWKSAPEDLPGIIPGGPETEDRSSSSQF